jgi:23S rRNA (guanine1835-N2)-methyltransferase
METQYHSPFGETLTLRRFPHIKAEGRAKSLRAWDAADEYLLQHLNEEYSELLENTPHTIIINDSFGALTTALRHLKPDYMSDSFIATKACQQNLQNNAAEIESITWLNSLQIPDNPLDLVLIKIPKTRALLEDILYRLSPFLNKDTVILGCAMVKNLHKNDIAAFEKILGPTHTTLAKKKARLVVSQFDPEQHKSPQISPYPTELIMPEQQLTLGNHANVFSQSGLDIGSRFFIEHLPATQGEVDIIDLGCGNGLLGILAARSNPQARLHFTDESYMAVASTEDNFHYNLPERKAAFHTNNNLDAFINDSADLILNNPPFHQQHVVGDHIARQMFADSKRVLRSGGELWVIGNRHLNYHQQLKRLFGHCELVASNNKFVILKASKR